MKHLVISCSLSPTSKSALMAHCLSKNLRVLGDDVELVDLREVPLPFCDGANAYEETNVVSLSKKIGECDAIALAMPVYNYDVGGAARNLIALTGSAWKNQIVGLVAAAGGKSSYMSLMSIGNSLMLDFRCVIVPRFVYASREAFADQQMTDTMVTDRLQKLAAEMKRFAKALPKYAE